MQINYENKNWFQCKCYAIYDLDLTFNYKCCAGYPGKEVTCRQGMHEVRGVSGRIEREESV